jgi:aminopeptidase N
MLLKVASFELRYQLRQPVFWVIATIFFLLVFGAVTSDQIGIGLGPNDHRNGPFALAEITLNAEIFFMFVTTAFVAGAVVRDDETGFAPIIRATRIKKLDYLIGRFAGAFAAVAVAFLAVPLAVLVGSFMPWMDPEALGPVRLGDYLYAFLVLALPGLLLTSAAFFALTTLTRSMMATYLGVVAFFVLWFVARTWARQLELDDAAAALDPFGASAYVLATKYWTTAERNAMNPVLQGALLWNRLGAIGLSAALLAGAYALFRFEPRPSRAARRASRAAARAVAAPPPPIATRPRIAPRLDLRAALAQLTARTRLDMAQVFKSPGYIVLMAIGLLVTVANVWRPDQLVLYGVGIHPVTRVMINGLYNGFSLFPIIIAIYYAGDLVWRERDRRTQEMVDSTPVPDWAFVAPKTLAITLVLASSLIVSVLTAMVVQALKGYADFQLDKYLLWYLLPQTVDMFLIAALAVFIQAVSPHKVVGWGVTVLYIVATLVLPGLGFEHHLYIYGTSPFVPLSDMNGAGRFWIGACWFRIYWAAWAVLLLALAHALWNRGVDNSLRPRLRRLPARLRGPTGVLIGAALVVFLASGIYIFINTNVWNSYRSQVDEDRWLADYEKTLLRYETAPQPKITDVRLDVDIEPGVPRVVTRGVFILENRTNAPLREIHVRFPRDLVMRSLSIEGARPKTTFDRFNYRIFAFDTPMAPGERRSMAFETVLGERGFRNERDVTSVVRNGTFVNDREIAPSLGMDRNMLLKDRRKRAKYGLARELPMARLAAPGADQVNYVGHDADWVNADIRVTTDADQTPIAPGYRLYDRTSGGRRTAEFKTEAPILRFFSIQSAHYDVRREPYKGIELSVFYHPAHAWNVNRMIAAAKASFDYYQANFSPYQFRQLRFLEFPAIDGRFAQSFAGTVPWSEDLGFITDLPQDSSQIDYVTYVGAHEIAHQWWAHQIVGADEQGSTALSETLAQYSALMVMKHMYGPDMIRRFLKFELDRYLRARGGDPLPEQPLETVEDQDYIHYRKGSLVMYRLQDEIGEDAVNRALRRLLASYAFKGPPYPTSLDLVKDLRAEAPADKQALITDLFEKITLYDLKAVKASSRRRPDGRWDVTLTVTARKLYADGSGHERAAPMDETLDVGLFDAEPGKPGFTAAKVIAVQRLPIRSGQQVLHLIAPRAPKFAGVDPYNKLIDRNADDNVVKVAG